jgi:hypothetical protein
MKKILLVFLSVTILKSIIIFVFLLGTIVVALAGESEKPCTDQEAKQAEEQIDLSLDWGGVYKLYKNFAHCDDASISEGFSDMVSNLLSEKWNTIYRLNQLVLGDEGFERFVLKHIDELMSPSQAEKIRNNAVAHCPSDARRLCKAISDRLKEIDEAIERSKRDRP